jgi:diguanylate cyclase (GGDEF)-like protein
MSDILQSVADLIDVRDRESLEVTLARVTFELTGARALTFWRVFRRADGVWLRRRVALPPTAEGCEPYDEEDVAVAQSKPPLRAAFESKDFARWRERPGDPTLCVFPVLGASDVLGLIEIELPVEPDRDRLSVVSGMLRIYHSHLAGLDNADTDELTRLANRRTFDDQFSRVVVAEARRNGARRISDQWSARSHIGVADIDFFKQINDRFGHPYGDEVLMLFANLMSQSFREVDRLFRFGGEEFVVLMSDCSFDDALVAFERFRAAVEAFPFPQVGKVTVSIGVTSIQLHDTGSAAFGRADQALYQAKRSGRNRVLCFESLQIAAAQTNPRGETGDVEFF